MCIFSVLVPCVPVGWGLEMRRKWRRGLLPALPWTCWSQWKNSETGDTGLGAARSLALFNPLYLCKNPREAEAHWFLWLFTQLPEGARQCAAVRGAAGAHRALGRLRNSRSRHIVFSAACKSTSASAFLASGFSGDLYVVTQKLV